MGVIRTALCPSARDLVFLTDPRFILKPDFYDSALREAGVVGHVVRAVVMAQGQAPGYVGSHTAEVPRDALPDRLQRLPPACAGGGMSTDELARAMIHGDEHIGAPLTSGDRLGHICPPHLVDPVGDNRAIVRMGILLNGALRREQIMFAFMTRRTRRGAVRTPCARSRAQTLR